jgi:hypothetical protein
LREKVFSVIKDVDGAQFDVTATFSEPTNKLRTDVDYRGRVVLTETLEVCNQGNKGKFGTHPTAKVFLILGTHTRKLAGVFNLHVEDDPGRNPARVEVEPACTTF